MERRFQEWLDKPSTRWKHMNDHVTYQGDEYGLYAYIRDYRHPSSGQLKIEVCSFSMWKGSKRTKILNAEYAFQLPTGECVKTPKEYEEHFLRDLEYVKFFKSFVRKLERFAEKSAASITFMEITTEEMIQLMSSMGYTVKRPTKESVKNLPPRLQERYLLYGVKLKKETAKEKV